MSYTVVGLFRNEVEAQNAKNQLETADFKIENIDYSAYKSQGDYIEHNYQYKEEEETTSFWDWLFGSDDDDNVDRVTKERYSRLGSRSNVLVVYAENKLEAEKAREIMDSAGSIDTDEYDRNLSEYNRRYANTEVANEDFDKNIEVIREEMKVGKREVEKGGVRVKSRIVEKPVEESVRLRKERVYVKRNKVNRPAENIDWDGFREGVIELHETDQEAVVSKDARVVEEISVGKDVDTETKTIKDTVRETEVDIERLDEDKI